MHNRFILGLLALAVFLPLPFAANPAHAQSFSSSLSAPRIDGFDVQPVLKAAPAMNWRLRFKAAPAPPSRWQSAARPAAWC
jgi:hypothetical protein